MTRTLRGPRLMRLLLLARLFEAGRERRSAAEGPKQSPSRRAQATTKIVPAGFDVDRRLRGRRISDIAPLVAGRVFSTPVDAGDFVRQGQVIAELDHRDAQLRLEQARAQLTQATAAHAAGAVADRLRRHGTFDPSQMPEVAAARATYESAQAQAKQAAADAQRFANLVATGDVSRSNYEKFRTQQETAEAQANAARQQYEASLNAARQGWGGVEESQAAVEARAPCSRRRRRRSPIRPFARPSTATSPPARSRGRVRRAHQQDRDHREDRRD